MIANSVAVKCGSGGNINVPLDLDLSYWNPSGDQNRPAQGGFDALGPAIVLTPTGALPTNVECGLFFADGSDPLLPAIVDKQGERVCTPPNGDVEQACASVGDMSAFKFKVEPLTILPQSIAEGDTNVPRNIGMGGSSIDFLANVPLSIASLSNVTLAPAVAGVTVTIVGAGNNARTIRVSGPAGTQLAATTLYTLTISTGVTDSFNQPLPQQLVLHFTSGA
jgi:hypothetical protein